MMKIKKTILLVLCGVLITSFSFGQGANVSDLLKELSKIKDQYGDNFDRTKVDKKFTLIFIEGTNTMLPEIYAKFKYKKLTENTLVVGGMVDVMQDVEKQPKYKHMTDGFKSNEGLGKDAYPILLDINSVTLKMLKLNKYSIVTVDINKSQLDIQDYGSDRVEFLKAIRIFFKPSKS